MSDTGHIAVVTGASRGAGAGIARALGSHGYTVYVTGRTESAGKSTLSGTIHETATQVTASGGKGIAVRVDHADDDQVSDLFERIGRDHGRIDVLVNNAAIIRDEMMGRTKFWEEPLNVIDTLVVGLRSSYVASVFAAPLMLPQNKGLIVFTSSSGSVHYAFGPAYGVPKAGTDKMAADMAVDFEDSGIAAVSIWMGSLLTQRVRDIVAKNPAKFGRIIETAETPELTGHVIARLYDDPALSELSGQTLIGAELAAKYGIQDEAGRQPPSYRDLHGVHPHAQFPYVMR
ncbi:NAD(P)-dependent dehydrogenase, short-chain alcohol dehydrogenase family [Mycobacterium rhizamassiliense]|jgi:NAD(P)-dependent dehydrogenase (short-subunit alcohol dehydrogenase family)|uniref:NAD(P)-dependent dehydrogenase, short-chain alcohol dehydrogenase family n=1 Tax=Mycobacterium rhizamassiliense TaxID=1841860 RepID=A0A2U3NTI8_9MYCO|nr:SDR family NAD(P)-dependent oxidoreductase [Mycobacterium rhizamassiliense]SPM34755.1 NAD(P)-dependent dehydrogenase, short-chain alcohol dehydrogenase family [Mycobacterium rhizamassiliense]